MFRIQHHDAFTVIGLPLRTHNREGFQTIPAHWQRFFAEQWAARIPGRRGDDVIALYTEFEHAGRDNTGDYRFVIGVPVQPGAVPPDGCIQVDVPAVRCAVFEVERGHPERVGEAWRAIWQHDAQTLPRRFTCDHERYQPDGHIHIAVGLR